MQKDRGMFLNKHYEIPFVKECATLSLCLKIKNAMKPELLAFCIAIYERPLSLDIIPIFVAVHTHAQSITSTSKTPMTKFAFAATIDTQPKSAVMAYMSNTACFCVSPIASRR